MAPLIVITGPTASGKSALALELAARWGGEIICADSRTVYKGMDIGTAKPTTLDRSKIRHHLLDVVNPNEKFTVHDFQTKARRAIDDIRGRGGVPFLVGGSGLYIDSIVLDYNFGSKSNPLERQKLQTKTIPQLQTMLKNQHIPLPENSLNKRHLVRALERKRQPISRRDRPEADTYVVAITTEKTILSQRIKTRVEAMFAAGVIDEASGLASRYGWECESMTGNIYAVARQLKTGLIDRQQAIELCTKRDLRLVKRQLTWLRRNAYVKWLNLEQAEQYFDHILSDYRDSSRH